MSYGTVSRVLNGGRWVSEDAREAVEQAIRQTGYTANHSARSLATGRTNSIAFLLAEPQNLLFSDPTYALLLRGCAEELARRSMTLVLLVAGSEQERTGAAEFVRAGHVDGVLLISSHESDPLRRSLVDAGIPTVACGVPPGDIGALPTVSVDEVASARTVAAHLRDAGRRRIAMISGPDDTAGGRGRLAGFREELGDLFDSGLVEYGDFGTESGEAAMTRLLERADDIDAVFAASDQMAIGAIAAIRHRGLSVPGDIAVAGFDDSGPAETADPPLTTVRQPWDLLSANMVASLVTVIETGRAESVVLPTSLVVRESA